MFRRTPAWSMVVCLARIVMPFSRSRSPESMTRSTTAWLDRNAPVWRSIASTRVVLPWSTCATMATLRRSARMARFDAGVVASGTVGYCSWSDGTADCPTERVFAAEARWSRVHSGAMTVAAVILSSSVEGSLADTLGQPRIRRLADLAWSGGALPIVVVSPDRDGAVAAALAGSEATYGSPAPAEAGPVGQMVRGAELALAEVHDTTAVLLWPGRMTWVGPETITSLIEAHGMDRAAMLRPAWHGEPGWP